MKKTKKTNAAIILGLAAIMFISNPVFAHNQFYVQQQKEMMKTGFRILNANNIEKRMTFYYEKNRTVDSVAKATSKRVVVYSGLSSFIDDENELAGILAHQIARNVENHKGLWKRTTNSFTPKNFEKRADCRAVDLMVNAGYNPIALIVVMNKLLAEPNWFDLFGGTKGSKRMMNVYKYIYEKYPQYLVKNEYFTNLYYQNFLITTKKSRSEFKKKLDEKNIVPVTNKSKKIKPKKSQQQATQI